MFFKPANSDTENGIKKEFKMSPECAAETGKSDKKLLEISGISSKECKFFLRAP